MFWEEEKKVIGNGLLEESNLPAVTQYIKGWFKKNPCCIANIKKDRTEGLILTVWQKKKEENLHSLNFNEIHIPYSSVLYTDDDGNLRIVLPNGLTALFSSEGKFMILNKYITLTYEEE